MTSCNRTYESLTAAEIQEIEAKMRPGQLSDSGFLTATDSLIEVQRADRDYLVSRGITYQQIANALITIYQKYQRAVQLRLIERHICPAIGDYQIDVKSWMGAQRCPFQPSDDQEYHGYEYGSTDVSVTNIKTGQKLVFNTLLPHMIEHHHFFESPGVSHRVEPQAVIDMFNLQPGVDNTPEYQQETHWYFNGSCSIFLEGEKFKSTDQALSKLAIDKDNYR